MANVIYNSNVEGKAFCVLAEGTYFNYQGNLFILVDECSGHVFSFNDDNVFCWYDDFDSQAIVQPISSDRITVRID